MLPPAPVSTLTWSEAVPFLLALAGSCIVVYASLYHGAQTSPTTISLGWVFQMELWLIASMNSSSCVGAPLVLSVVWAVAAVVTLGWMLWRAISSWWLWSLPTFMASVLPPHPWWQLWFLCGCLDFTCCDPVGGAFLGGGAFLSWSALPMQHLGPQCPVLSHLEQWESHARQFVLLAGCSHVQLGQSLEGTDGVWPLPLWLVLSAWHLSWQIVSTGLELWETCSQACWMAKWFTAMSASLQEGVLKVLQ